MLQKIELPQMTRQELSEDFRTHAINYSLIRRYSQMDQLRVRSRLSGRDREKLSLRHPQRLPFVGGAGHLLWSSLQAYGINRTNVYTTNVVKRQISLSRKGNERHIVHETNSISGSACSNGNSGSFPIAALSSQWETMLSKLFSEIPESPTGGDLLLTQSFPMEDEDESYVPLTLLTHSVNLNLSRSFEWTARSSTSLIEMSLDHIRLRP